MKPKAIFPAVICLCIAISGFAGSVARSEEINIQGATTVTFGLMVPKKSEIEALSGQTLKILPSSTTRGLNALAAGGADVAMLAEPLADAVAAVLKSAPGSIDITKLEGFHVANAETQIILHPANPVSKLDTAQIAGLFSGKIANWKEIGGPDMPVLVVTEPTSAPHQIIQRVFGFTMLPTARIVQNASQTAQIVSQAQGAISYLSTAHQVPERDRVKVVSADKPVPLELYVAIRKDASPDVRKVVDAARQIGGLK